MANAIVTMLTNFVTFTSFFWYLGKNRFRYLGSTYLGVKYGLTDCNTEQSGKKLPSASDIAKADDVELQEIMENAARSMEDLVTQLHDQTSSR